MAAIAPSPCTPAPRLRRLDAHSSCASFSVTGGRWCQSRRRAPRALLRWESGRGAATAIASSKTRTTPPDDDDDVDVFARESAARSVVSRPLPDLSRRGLALGTAGAALGASLPSLMTREHDVARALIDAANAQAVFEGASRGVVGLADYVPGGANGGYTALGTGVVWSEFGYVITNYHVVSAYLTGATTGAKNAAPKRLRVNVPDAKTDEAVWYDAEVIATQRSSDIAALILSPAEAEAGVSTGTKLQKLPGMTPIPVGDSASLRVGQSCYVIGAGDTSDADGKLGVSSFRQQKTLSAGVVSGLRRSIPSKNGSTIRNCIQTDAKVTETSAGGALLDSSGRLIGLTVTTFGNKGSSAGLNFAIPIDDLLTIVPSIIFMHQIS